VKTLKRWLFAFILGVCFSAVYSHILKPISLTAKYNKQVREIFREKDSKYRNVWVLV
jgi:hypothetical protein